MAFAVAYSAVNSILVYSLAPAIAVGRARLGEVLRLPILWSAAAALAVKFGGLTIPLWVMNTVELIGGIPIPIMLIALGVSLADLRVASMGRSVALSVLRLAMGFAVGLVSVELFVSTPE